MNRQAVATMLAIAFILLTLCGWGFFMLASDHGMAMNGMAEHAVYYNALIMSMSVQVFIAFLLILFVSALAATFSSGTSLKNPMSGGRMPERAEPIFWRPLQLAFSDGILNPKAY